MIQIDFITYELATGRILSTCSCPAYAYGANTPPSTQVGYLNGTVADINTYYVSDEEIMERPNLDVSETPIHIAANGIDSFDLNNLPQGTIVAIDPDDETHEINDGELSFATETPGIYTIHISAFPYKQATVTVEAHL